MQCDAVHNLHMIADRASGILLHLTSLPGAFGAGDFGTDAYKFVDWLVSAGQTYWQVLPLGEIGPGNSPYMSRSAFAGNIMLIDLAELASYGWLIHKDLAPHPEFCAGRVDFSLLHSFRMERLHRAAESFFTSRPDKMHRSYDEFCLAEGEWLEDYALFMTIEERENWREWNHWPKEMAHRNPQALHRLKQDCSDKISFWKFCQWCFARQWSRLKHYANERGVRIIGDVPIFVAYRSADVWAHQKLFELDEKGYPSVVAGVPPDYFSETGQLWGNPLYRWDAHKETGYTWWIARLRHALRQADMVRIDHFRGFAAYWEIPADAPNAIIGKWEPGPGANLFAAFEQAFPHLPIIAEDLGLITPDVLELRDQFKLPGMRVLQFAFGNGEDNPFLPHHYVTNTIAYTGTHDNDTVQGWFAHASEEQAEFAKRYLKLDTIEGYHWGMIRGALSSAAFLSIVPMQDYLGLGSEARMNTPATVGGTNWQWRMKTEDISDGLAQKIAALTRLYGRA